MIFIKRLFLLLADVVFLFMKNAFLIYPLSQNVLPKINLTILKIFIPKNVFFKEINKVENNTKKYFNHKKNRTHLYKLFNKF